MRTDLVTASRIDLALSLLPLIGQLEVARMMARNGVPMAIARRVLAFPMRRR
jgi:hypothetical protein